MLEFPRINQALTYTLQYYESSRIADHLLRFAHPSKDKSTSSLLDAYYEATLESYKRMDDEIQQTIHTTNRNTQTYLFENLKRWLVDYRIKEVHISTIVVIADQYNDKVEVGFYNRLEEEEKKFRETPNYQLAHLEEYEEAKPTDHSLIPFWKAMRSFVGKKINYKFRCIHQGPELIDFSYLSNYIDFIEGILANFRNTVQFHVNLWDKGMIATSVEKITEQTNLPAPLVSNHTYKKIKTNLSVERLAYLYKLLYEDGLIEADMLKEIHEFIAKNFQPTTKKTDISVGKLARVWSDTDPKTIQFWRDKFIDLYNRIKKDNPNLGK